MRLVLPQLHPAQAVCACVCVCRTKLFKSIKTFAKDDSGEDA